MCQCVEFPALVHHGARSASGTVAAAESEIVDTALSAVDVVAVGVVAVGVVVVAVVMFQQKS